jgi:hypothetical protein
MLTQIRKRLFGSPQDERVFAHEVSSTVSKSTIKTGPSQVPLLRIAPQVSAQ